MSGPSEVGERSGRNAALSRALGGGVAAFPSANMSMGSFSAGGFPFGAPGIAGRGGRGSSASTPSMRARLRIVGQNGVGGWVDVDAGEDGATKDIVFGQMLGEFACAVAMFRCFLQNSRGLGWGHGDKMTGVLAVRNTSRFSSTKIPTHGT